jgi:HTH-type transcriptional regulator/antitoxin HigA
MIKLIAPQFKNKKMATLKKIANASDYKNVMAKIDSLMAKGSGNVTKSELAEIRRLAVSAQGYEQNKFVIEVPTTLAGIIEMKMYEMKLKQKDLARKLKVSDTKLSLVMSGKQKPDVNFLKAVNQQLNVNGDFLLKVI